LTLKLKYSIYNYLQKYFDVKLSIQTQNLYAENYTMLMKKNFNDLIEWYTVFMGWKIQHNKNGNSPQIDIVANTIPIKILAKFLVNTDKIILKCIWEGKGTKKPKIILKKKNKVGRIHITNVTTYFIVTAIKIVWYWWWDRNTDQ